MDFKVGDKVVMDRGCEFFKTDIFNSPTEKLIWWAKLEESQPLTIESIEHMFGDVNDIKVVGLPYSVSNHWIKACEEDQQSKDTFT